MPRNKRVITGTRHHINASVCPIYFISQVAYFDYVPDESVTLNEQAVAVVGEYAYVVRRGVTDYTLDITHYPAHLLTFDLTDPYSPTLVDDQEITAPTDTEYVSPGIVALGTDLWVTATVNEKVVPKDEFPIIYGQQVIRYDISTQAAPSRISSWDTRLWNEIVAYRHYDTGTLTFTGQPYLVGFNWDWNDPPVEYTEMIVEDALVGGEVQTLTGYNFGMGVINNASDVNDTPAVLCGNIALTSIWEGSADSTTTRKMLGVDLSAIPGGAMAVLWEQDNVAQPEVYLGANHAYVREFSGGYVLYTQTDVDGTNVFAGGVPPFPSESANLHSWGYFVNGNCLLRVDNNLNRATAMGISTQTSPTADTTTTAPIGTEGSAQFSSADKVGDRVLLCHVGKADSIVYLAVFSNLL